MKHLCSKGSSISLNGSTFNLLVPVEVKELEGPVLIKIEGLLEDGLHVDDAMVRVNKDG